ncbi:unnamed protein product [Urochloa humidicola]
MKEKIENVVIFAEKRPRGILRRTPRNRDHNPSPLIHPSPAPPLLSLSLLRSLLGAAAPSARPRRSIRSPAPPPPLPARPRRRCPLPSRSPRLETQCLAPDAAATVRRRRPN